jgi:phage-related protein
MAILKPGLDLLVAYFRVLWAEAVAIVKTAFDIIAAVVKIYIAGIVLTLKVAWDIIVGLFDIALALITGHWGKAWADMKLMLTQVWNAIKQYFGSVWGDIESLVRQVLSNIEGFFDSAWHAIKSGVVSAFSDILGLFGGLPRRILGTLAGLAGEMFSFGAHIISMLASGIMSAIGDVTHAISSIGGEILDHIPHSPAKKGPLSGSGDPVLAGRKIAQMLSHGMVSDLAGISAASSQMTGAVRLGAAGARGYGTAGGGALTLEVTGGGSGLDELFITWLKEKVRVKGGGGTYSVQKALGSTWPRGA